MEWIKSENLRIPIKSWCNDIDEEALRQAINLANHPVTFKHIAIMPDCHVGYGMPIGAVAAVLDAIIPNAVGVDIGCGMRVLKTDYKASALKKEKLVELLNKIKKDVPLGEGHSHKKCMEWEGFDKYLTELGISNLSKARDLPGWLDIESWELDRKNLGTLGGGNHFIEIQEGNDGYVWVMIHSGSRNLGYRIAHYYHKLAASYVQNKKINIPDKDLSFLPIDVDEAKLYLRDMEFALKYAKENRRRIMEVIKNAFLELFDNISFSMEYDIHHNYASKEVHFGKTVWVHRKGATSAKKNEKGIIPGSMGSSSYIVEGLGNPESFFSSSHGAGRKLGRKEACRVLDINECNKLMKDIVFDNFKKIKIKKETYYDLSESSLAYKDIEEVIKCQLDLIKPLVKLKPLAVLKG